ncbi:MAG TPA: xylose isomerase, partial [Armatimonadota bacterium]|nr:xylose isomerase [Armatimonadota bacterium]
MRPWIMFTKHLEGYDLGQIIDGLKSGGVQGADLCVRPGYPVNPENAKTELPAAAKRFADEGLCIPLITTPGDFTDASVDYAEGLFEACAEAGVKLVKLGYWQMEDDGYWATLDRCRAKLEGFAKLAEKTGVKPVVHNHSGATMGLNSSAVMNLMEGMDPG